MCKLIDGFENYTIDRQGNVFNLIKATYKTPTSSIVNVLKGRQSYTKDFVWCYVESLGE